MLTGLFPSENHVYHLEGRVRNEDKAKSLTAIMRAAGYATGAFISGPAGLLPCEKP